MSKRKNTTKKTILSRKGKIIQPDEPESLTESEKEIARKLRRIKKDLQPGNGHIRMEKG